MELKVIVSEAMALIRAVGNVHTKILEYNDMNIKKEMLPELVVKVPKSPK